MYVERIWPKWHGPLAYGSAHVMKTLLELEFLFKLYSSLKKLVKRNMGIL